ncbi:restriction endonuclease [Roseibacterium beibuensis]|uniref:restriction endonuclease n=1 Tax=[Roseibacterium] beibuensis TaxID=1193142 RepID=UPI00217EA297|nr:restriction endonuclease [Roseibacterium beibuensis]MCS6625646.1 restriction endonuclease [Roseibacterium beibuensis]
MSAAQCEAKIRRLDWAGLRRLWTSIAAGRTKGWASGKAFEYLVLRAFELSGATVRWPYAVNLDGAVVEQIDGAIHISGLSCLVESKDTIDPVNIEPIAKLRNQLLRRHSSAMGLLFSKSGFTSPAITLAHFLAPQSILLWSGEEVSALLDVEDFSSALLSKYRAHVEDGVPDYDVRAAAL